MRGLEDMRLLVVDDEELLRQILAEELTELGCQVAVAGGGEEAFHRAAQGGIDLVLTDIRMPGTDGVYLLDRIRREIGPRLPVIFMSGYAEISVWEAFDRGVEAFLGKPFALDALEAVATRLCGRPRREPKAEQLPSYAIRRVYADERQAASDSGFARGRGGIFLGWDADLAGLRQNDRVRLDLDVLGDPGQSIHGEGTVRWRRALARELPAGVGIELDAAPTGDGLAYIPKRGRGLVTS